MCLVSIENSLTSFYSFKVERISHHSVDGFRLLLKVDCMTCPGPERFDMSINEDRLTASYVEYIKSFHF